MISMEDTKPTQNGHSGASSVLETHATSQTNGMDLTSTLSPMGALRSVKLFGMYGALKTQTRLLSMTPFKRSVKLSLLPRSWHPCMETPNFSSDTSDSKKISKPAPTGDPMFKCLKNQPLLRISLSLSKPPLNAHSTTYSAWCEKPEMCNMSFRHLRRCQLTLADGLISHNDHIYRPRNNY